MSIMKLNVIDLEKYGILKLRVKLIPIILDVPTAISEYPEKSK